MTGEGFPKDPHVVLVGNSNPLVSINLVATEYGTSFDYAVKLMLALKVPIFEVDGRLWVHLYALERAVFEKTVLVPEGYSVDDYMKVVGEYVGASRTTAIRESLRCSRAAYEKLHNRLKNRGKARVQAPKRSGRRPNAPTSFEKTRYGQHRNFDRVPDLSDIKPVRTRVLGVRGGNPNDPRVATGGGPTPVVREGGPASEAAPEVTTDTQATASD